MLPVHRHRPRLVVRDEGARARPAAPASFGVARGQVSVRSVRTYWVLRMREEKPQQMGSVMAQLRRLLGVRKPGARIVTAPSVGGVCSRFLGLGLNTI